MSDKSRIGADDDPRRAIDEAAEAADDDVRGLSAESRPDAEQPEPAGRPAETVPPIENTVPPPVIVPPADVVPPPVIVPHADVVPPPVIVPPADTVSPTDTVPSLAAVPPTDDASSPQVGLAGDHDWSDPTVDEATGGAHAGEAHAPSVAGAATARTGARGMGHVAEHDAADPNDWWKTWLLRTGAALLATLVLGTALIWAWLGGLANPTARNIPVAVIGGDSTAIAVLSVDQENTELKVVHYKTARSAIDALSKRKVSAILASDQPGLSGGLNLTIASGAGPGVANAVVNSINSVTSANNIPLAIEDVYPTSAKDADGRTPFYLMMAWIIGGLIAAVILGVALGTVPRDLDRLGMRLGALFVFSLILGLIGALFAGPFLGIWHRHTFGLWMTGTLIVFTAALITSALQSWLGMWGIGVSVLLLLVLGVPGSGGLWGSQLIPGFFRSMHSWVPNGLGTDLIRGLEYFGRNANTWPITGLALWALASIVALVASTTVLGRHARPVVPRPGDLPPEPPATTMPPTTTPPTTASA